MLKINTNGSSCGNLGHAGIGCVRWTSFGIVEFIFSVYKGWHTNNVMEALAILCAMEHGCVLKWRQIICESDS